jgi:hypothetical protein
MCVRGTWRPPPLMEKLLSGDRIKVTNARDLASAFVSEHKWQVKLTLGETW